MATNSTRSGNGLGSACQSCARRYSTLNLLINLSLAVIKGFVGVIAGSQALVAAALYSLTDAFSAIVVMVSTTLGNKPADEDHPYGHGKAEFVAIGIMGIALALCVVGILVFSLVHVFKGSHSAPHLIAGAVAALSVASNGFLARRGYCVARFLGSPAVYTSAEHSRADAISSLAVLAGVGGAHLGVHWLDPLVAVFEAVHIAWLAGRLLGKAIKGLTDAAAPRSTADQIEAACTQIEGVERVLELRTRAVGSQIWADLIVAVPREYSVRRAQQVCEQVRERLPVEGGIPILAQVSFRPAGVLDPAPPTEVM